MRLSFHGAAGGVTGSCYLLQANGKKVLIDCGMRQGRDAKTGLPEDTFPFSPDDIDCMLLTHAHIDHSGRIPLLVKQGFKGAIFCTYATGDLCSIMLPDSGHIQEAEAEWQNRKRQRSGKKPVEPLYTVRDAQEALKYFSPASYGATIEITPGITARFVDAGHLLGSSSIEVWIKENGTTTKLAFSGDIGQTGRPILRDPEYITDADYVICESTYGDRLHEVERKTIDQFADVLKDGLARGGNIVIPSFAVGRTQELLYDLNRLLNEKRVPGLEKVTVYIDSPLAIEATKVFMRNYLTCYDDEATQLIKSGINPFQFPTLRAAQTAEESMMINTAPSPKIIISASGMCEAGRIKHHLKHNIWRADSTVLFVGYQAEGTLGRKITDGENKLNILGEDITVHAQIVKIEGYSGHADRDGLMKWLGAFKNKPTRLFIIHGEDEARESLQALASSQLGMNCTLPRMDEEYELVPGHSRMVSESKAKPAYTPEAEAVSRKLRENFERISTLISSKEAVLASGTGDIQRLRKLSEELEQLHERWNGTNG